MRRTETRPRTTEDTPTFKIDRVKFADYCKTIGHSETTLSSAYRGSGYLSKRFNLYEGKLPGDFITWCDRMYPTGREKLAECIIHEEEKKPAEPKTEQMAMPILQAPSMIKDKIVTIQPVSIAGFNQLIDALNLISERLRKLEEAWNGQRE